MDFIMRKAVFSDLPAIMEIMETADRTAVQREWFVSDSEDYMKSHITGHGFTILAQTCEGKPAGFFLIKFPGLSGDNLGRLLDFPDETLKQTVHMDMAAVLPDFRGHQLQSRMLQEAEYLLRTEYPNYHYLMATVHPDNLYSLNNMKKNGYDIVLTTRLYGGLLRHVLLKRS